MNKQYTPEACAMILNPVCKDAELAKQLGRSVWAIRAKRRALRYPIHHREISAQYYARGRVGDCRRYEPWDEYDIAAIMKEPKRVSDAVLASCIRRSVQAVQQKRYMLRRAMG